MDGDHHRPRRRARGRRDGRHAVRRLARHLRAASLATAVQHLSLRLLERPFHVCQQRHEPQQPARQLETHHGFDSLLPLPGVPRRDHAVALRLAELQDAGQIHDATGRHRARRRRDRRGRSHEVGALSRHGTPRTRRVEHRLFRRGGQAGSARRTVAPSRARCGGHPQKPQRDGVLFPARRLEQSRRSEADFHDAGGTDRVAADGLCARRQDALRLSRRQDGNVARPDGAAEPATIPARGRCAGVHHARHQHR